MTEGNGGPGPGVDARGRPVVDPTANVISILEAAVQRQDDLREAEGRRIDEKAELRAEYDEKLREAESKRIDAIRAVDVGAVNRAAEVAAAQATTLAAQVATSAETLRTQVAAAASAATIALAAALEPVQKDIADLRRAQYEALGQKTQGVEDRGANQWGVGLAIGVGLSVIGLAISASAVIIAVAR